MGLKSFSFLTVILFFEHFALGCLLSLDGHILHQVIAGLHSVFVAGIFYYVYCHQDLIFKNVSGVRPVIYMTLAVHLGILLGVALLDSTGAMLWVVDSKSTHVPMAENVVGFLVGNGFGSVPSGNSQLYLAHVLSGVFFLVFGVNQLASGLALMLGKLGAVFYLFQFSRELVDDRAARLATLIYILLPTALFYTVTFYKEATVQFLVAMACYYMFRIHRHGRWQEFLLLCLALLLLGNERHYLAPCFGVAMGLLIIFSRRIPVWLKAGMLISGAVGYDLFCRFYWAFSVDNVLATIQNYRTQYLSFPDVSEINKTLPYPIAVVKLYLSPYFTMVKISSYFGPASLIAWGSFLYQITAVLAPFGFLKLVKEETSDARIVTIVTIPFFILVAVFGYVAPYNGRLRDSFLPLLCLFAVVGARFLKAGFTFQAGTTIRKIAGVAISAAGMWSRSRRQAGRTQVYALQNPVANCNLRVLWIYCLFYIRRTL